MTGDLQRHGQQQRSTYGMQLIPCTTQRQKLSSTMQRKTTGNYNILKQKSHRNNGSTDANPSQRGMEQCE